jgi:uracil-DNA glycosylase
VSGIKPDIHESWRSALEKEFTADYFLRLKEFLVEEKKRFNVFPAGKMIFNALNHTPLDKVKVVIIGQDPYHGENQAHGLCFSVQDGVKPPPSLVNIFRELNRDLGISIPKHGNLTSWADQGVLLLNATLTVRANAAGSHQKKGWEEFTDAIIRVINDQKKGVVFLLWGNYAQKKAALVDPSKHTLLTAPHPSPLAGGGFSGCAHFSRTNEILIKQGQEPIDWNL